jgi:hypothetical protein
MILSPLIGDHPILSAGIGSLFKILCLKDSVVHYSHRCKAIVLRIVDHVDNFVDKSVDVEFILFVEYLRWGKWKNREIMPTSFSKVQLNFLDFA